MLQEILVFFIVGTASIWLGRNLWRRVTAPPCQPPSKSPPGSDGFVPLEELHSYKEVK
ncbi:MAG: hypothetical protein MUQ67_10175 [Pirellulales bacterium]|nr:hypothetical protein [Pirellulales bacterium]